MIYGVVFLKVYDVKSIFIGMIGFMVVFGNKKVQNGSIICLVWKIDPRNAFKLFSCSLANNNQEASVADSNYQSLSQGEDDVKIMISKM